MILDSSMIPAFFMAANTIFPHPFWGALRSGAAQTKAPRLRPAVVTPSPGLWVSALAAAAAGLATSGERPWHWSILVQLGQSDLSNFLMGGRYRWEFFQQCWRDLRLKHWDINIQSQLCLCLKVSILDLYNWMLMWISYAIWRSKLIWSAMCGKFNPENWSLTSASGGSPSDTPIQL